VQTYINFQAMLIGGVMLFNLLFFRGKKSERTNKYLDNK
jgi:hypothetical protein